LPASLVGVPGESIVIAGDAGTGVLLQNDLVALGVFLKAGISGRALVEGGGTGSKRSPKTSSEGEDGRLAFAGGCPVGVEGGALFLPFLGGVEVIVVEDSQEKTIFEI
jgi:hypothetical protein